MKVLSLLNQSLINEKNKLEFLASITKSIRPDQMANHQKDILEILDTIDDINHCIKLINLNPHKEVSK